jgi:hypothetical protein
VCYCHAEKYTVGQLLQMLLLVHSIYIAEEMTQRVEYL